jgi:chaperonin cofactor prefoldin
MLSNMADNSIIVKTLEKVNDTIFNIEKKIEIIENKISYLSESSNSINKQLKKLLKQN